MNKGRAFTQSENFPFAWIQNPALKNSTVIRFPCTKLKMRTPYLIKILSMVKEYQ